MRKILPKLLINTALGLVLVFIWSRFINLNEIITLLKGVKLYFIFIFFIFFVFSGVLRALRFKLLLSNFKIPLKDLIMLHYLSQFLSFMIPIRAGELTKGVYLTSQYKLPFAKTIIWVFVDRFLDLIAVLLFISILFLTIPTSLGEQFTKTAFLLLAASLILVIFLVKNQNLLKKLTVFLSKFLVFRPIKERFISLTYTVIEGAEVLQKPKKTLFGIGVLTILATLSDSLIWFFVYLSFEYDLGILKTILGNSLTALGYLLPAAPGFVGSTEAGALAVFSGVLGIEANLVSAAAVFFHLFTIFTVMILGVGSLYFLKFDLGMVWKKIRR